MKHVKQITINGYRGFRKEDTVQLAIPDGAPGSGLTVLTGANNAGKSSVIELVRALASRTQPEFVESQRNRKNAKVHVRYAFEDDTEVELVSTAGGSASTTWSAGSNSPLRDRIYYIPAARNIAPFFGKGQLDRRSYSRQAVELTTERNQAVDPNGFLQTIEGDRGKKKAFDSKVAKLLGFPVKWKLDRLVTGQYVFSISGPTGTHYSDGLGYGVLSVFYLVAGLMDSADSDVICIDEPEISMHPQVQRRVANYLGEKSADTQIVLATHSPYFVDPEWLARGTELLRCYVAKDTTRIGRLSDTTKTRLRRFSSDLNNPHVFGLDAREIFFATGNRRVLVVEGQEDVVILSRILESVGARDEFEIFGWGAGGAEKIPYVVEVLQDLGLSDIATLVDGDQAKLHKFLKAKYPDLRHAILPTGDIRDKPKRGASAAKVGVCTSGGQLKPEFEESVTGLLEGLRS